MIVVGIDPHKKTHTAVAVDGVSGAEVATLTVKARAKGHERLLSWARSIDSDLLFAVEDCRHVSGGLQRFLLARGERMKPVPPKLMAGTRRGARTRGKSDPIDARAVAQAALRHPELPGAHLAGVERDVRLLLDHWEDLVTERTRYQNRLRWHLHDLDPAFEVPTGGLDRSCWLDRTEGHLEAMEQGVQVRMALGEVRRIRELTQEARRLERELTTLVRLMAPELLAIPGCGPLTAAKLLGETGGVRRFRSEAAFAMHVGTGPLEVSSGERQRHRLSRSGNRQLNAALHRIAITQLRIHPPAQAFLERKRREGKGKREALRCLKRHLARVVYKTLLTVELRRKREMTDTAADAAVVAA
ncbi:MAG: IS110 family transposase [Actinomycetota bacterium]